MSREPSSPPPPDPPGPGGEVVDLFVVGRTLRGTLGRAFLADCVERHERMRGAGPAVRTALARTVELTAAAVTRAGNVQVRCSIADPAFLRPAPLEAAASHRLVFTVAADSLDGIEPVAGGADGPDRRRTIEVAVEIPPGSGPPRLIVHVVTPPAPRHA